MNQKELFRRFQVAMNNAGASPKLTEDGDYGPKTTAMSEKFDFIVTAKLQPIVAQPVPFPADTDFFGAPWIGSFIHLLGLSETDPKLNAELVPYWAKVGLPQFKTLAGNDHAWCALFGNAAYLKQGIKGSGSAAAAKVRQWGKECPWWFGASLGINHASGGDHETFFLYWVDEGKRLAACFGGNQSNKLSVAQYNLSGNKNGHDEVINGPRFPIGWNGQTVSMADVLAKYPQLKVGGVAGSTR